MAAPDRVEARKSADIDDAAAALLAHLKMVSGRNNPGQPAAVQDMLERDAVFLAENGGEQLDRWLLGVTGAMLRDLGLMEVAQDWLAAYLLEIATADVDWEVAHPTR